MSTPSKRPREHLLLPDVFIRDPVFEIDLLVDGEVKKTYGLFAATEEEIEDGILFRACLLLDCSMADEELSRCRGRLRLGEDSCEYEYDFENLCYKLHDS